VHFYKNTFCDFTVSNSKATVKLDNKVHSCFGGHGFDSQCWLLFLFSLFDTATLRLFYISSYFDQPMLKKQLVMLWHQHLQQNPNESVQAQNV
jgi:hypothetical protein